MSELLKKLTQIPTYRTLQDVDAELKAVETPKNFNPNNLDHVSAQLERLKVREGLDKNLAIAAFRLDVARLTDDLLTTTERLSVIAAYDPEVRQRHIDNDQAVQDSFTRGARRGALVNESLRAAAAYGVEGWGVPSPERNAVSLVEHATQARAFAEKHAGKKVGIKVSRRSALLGTMPAADTAFALTEPVVGEHGIEYQLPTAFSGINRLESYSDSGLESLTEASFPSLTEVINGELVANPQLSRLRQDMGLLGVNIYRNFYLDDFDDSIVAKSQGLNRIMPEPRYRRTRRGGLISAHDDYGY